MSDKIALLKTVLNPIIKELEAEGVSIGKESNGNRTCLMVGNSERFDVCIRDISDSSYSFRHRPTGEYWVTFRIYTTCYSANEKERTKKFKIRKDGSVTTKPEAFAKKLKDLLEDFSAREKSLTEAKGRIEIISALNTGVFPSIREQVLNKAAELGLTLPDIDIRIKEYGDRNVYLKFQSKMELEISHGKDLTLELEPYYKLTFDTTNDQDLDLLVRLAAKTLQ